MTAATEPDKPRPRMVFGSIQALRGVAASLVVLFHAQILARGATGVDVFFVISGFIMGGVAIGERPGEFLANRLTRIVPLYWIMTLGYSLAAIFGLLKRFEFTPAELVMSLLFIPFRQMNGHVWPLLTPGWTLNFEMIFYLVFAVGLMTRWPRVITGVTMAVLGLTGLFWHPDDARLVVITNPIVMEFAAGLVLSRWAPVLSPRVGLVLLVLGTIAFGAMLAGPDDVDDGLRRVLTVGLPSVAIAAGVIAIEAGGRWPSLPLLGGLGDMSYSLYLTHGTALTLVEHLASHFRPGLQVLILSLVGLPLSVVVAALSYNLIERPSRRAFRAWTKERRAVAEAANA